MSDLKIEIAELVSKHPAITKKQPAGSRLVVDVSFRFELIPSYIEVLVSEKKLKLVRSEEKFTDEHFADLLELPLSGLDREFVEYFRKRKNKPMTPAEIVSKGFAEKGRMSSINAVCTRHGLWIRFSENGVRRVPHSWPDYEHQFCLMKERRETGQK